MKIQMFEGKTEMQNFWLKKEIENEIRRNSGKVGPVMNYTYPSFT